MLGKEGKEKEKILKALANKRRLAIVGALKKGELSVGDIAEKIHLSFKSTSRHLRLLSAADILEREQKGLTAFYSLSHSLLPLARTIISHL